MRSSFPKYGKLRKIKKLILSNYIEGNMYKIRIVVKKQPARYFMYYFGAVRQDDK